MERKLMIEVTEEEYELIKKGLTGINIEDFTNEEIFEEFKHRLSDKEVSPVVEDGIIDKFAMTGKFVCSENDIVDVKLIVRPREGFLEK